MPASDQRDYKELIPEVRQQFLNICNADPENYDEVDIIRIKTEDWWTLRFIKYHRGDVDKAVEHMDSALMWRKEFGVNNRDEKELPQEFVKAGALYPYGCDDKGRTMIYMRVKVYKKIPQLVQYFRQFVVGVINRVDIESGEKGYALVFDVTGVSMSNADMDFLQFLINTLKNSFPYGLRYVLVYNLPRLLRPLWAIAKMWVGRHQKIIKFANGDEIKEYIPVENIPKYLGGEAVVDFTLPPEGCKSVKELAPQYGFTEDEVNKYMKIFEPHIKEANKLVNGVN